MLKLVFYDAISNKIIIPSSIISSMSYKEVVLYEIQTEYIYLGEL